MTSRSLKSPVPAGLLFAGILAAGALVRVLFLQGLDRGINSDEAWTGLMALSILRGEYPIFLPGQAYMGSMEAYATAVVFLLFGSSPTTLYFVPFLLSVLLIVLIRRLGLRLWGEAGGVAAAVFSALPPAFLVVYGNSPRLGYVETLVWGTVLLLLTDRLVRSPSPARERSLLFVTGVFGGIAIWTNMLVVPFLATVAVVLILHRPRLVFQTRIAWILPGFFLGSSPFWIFNVRHDFWSFALLESGPGGELVSRVVLLLKEVLPFVLGMRDIVTGERLPYATVLLGAGYGALAFVGIFHLSTMGRRRCKHPHGPAASVPIVLALFTLLAYVASRYGSLGSPRYLFPFYTALPLILAAGVSTLWRSSRWWVLLAVPILVGNITGIAKAHHDFNVPGTFDPDVPPLRPVLEFLDREKIDRVYADYGISVRFNYETAERIVAAQPLGERHPPYALMVAEAPRLAVVSYGRFVFFDPGTFGKTLRTLGLEFKETTVGGWQIYHGFRSTCQPSVDVKPDLWRGKASETRDDPRLAFDRDVATRWGSGRPRQPGIWYALDLGRVEAVCRVALLPDVSATDYPVGLQVEVSSDERVWRPVSELRGIIPGMHVRGGQPRFDAGAIVEFAFPPVPARHLRFTHLGDGPPFDWSIGEIFVFSPDAGGVSGKGLAALSLARRDLIFGRWAEAQERLSCILALDRENMEAHRLNSVLAAGREP